MDKFVSVALVGKLNQDTVGDAPNQGELRDAKYRAASPLRVELGGASANVSKAISVLAKIYGDDCSTKIITRVGEPPSVERFKDAFGDINFGEFLAAKNAYENAFELMRHQGITVVDVCARGEEGPGVAAAMVTNYGGHINGGSGRAIITDPDVPEIERCHQSLSEGFNNAVHNLIGNIKPKIRNEVKGNGQIFIDPARPFLAYMAASVCMENNISYTVDYGIRKWPRDPQTAKWLSTVLKNADILIVPDDAVVEGMEDYVRNPDLLFEKLTGKRIKLNHEGHIAEAYEVEGARAYKANTVIMSNGKKPVLVTHKDKPYSITVEPTERAINKKGVGDTRDGALLFFLARGDDMLTAADKATAVAAIRVQYSGTEWKDHFIEEILANPRYTWLFRNDLDELKKMRWTAVEKLDTPPSGQECYEQAPLPMVVAEKRAGGYAPVPIEVRSMADSASAQDGDAGAARPEPD